MRVKKDDYLTGLTKFGYGYGEKVQEIVTEAAQKNKDIRFISYLKYEEWCHQWVEHIYAQRNTKSKGFQMQEVYTRYEDSTRDIGRNLCYSSYMGGISVLWQKKYTSYYCADFSYEWSKVDPFFQDLLSTKLEWNKYYVNLNDIMSDEKLKYCAYDIQCRLDVIDYIRLYRKYPVLEMISKLRLFRWLNEKACKLLAENKEFQKWTFKNATDLRHMTVTTAYNAFKKNKAGNPSDYYSSLICRMMTAKELCQGRKEVMHWVERYTTIEKVNDYLTKNKIDPLNYWDYCEAARWLQLNFNDTKVLFPKNFIEMHDEYTKQYADYQVKEMAKGSLSSDDAMMITAMQYVYVNQHIGDYIFIGAKNKEELIREGKAMENCVGRMNYDQRQKDGKSMIVFLRKYNTFMDSFITIELKLPELKVIQCYGKRNSVVTDEETLKAINSWKHIIKKEQKKKMEASA